MSAVVSDSHDRARLLLGLAQRAARGGLASLPDDAFIQLLDEYRWAVGRLAATGHDAVLRSTLNAAVLSAHTALHRRARRRRAKVGAALRRSGRTLGLCAAVFIGTGVMVAAVVLGDSTLAYAIVPRTMLAQIDGGAWGSRGSLSADVGMMFFYWGNNLRASFMALGSGVLGGIPAVLVLAYNGALLGAVAGVSATRGAGTRLLGWLAPHAVPELGALVLCGAIGLELGRSWLEPGWRDRRRALARAGHTLTPLAVVAAVLVVCAAPLEGFVAPMDLPPWLDLSMAGAWVAVLLGGAVLALRSDGPRQPDAQ
jgi:uncharacterized membrane protein SpoIIM required for sporulation